MSIDAYRSYLLSVPKVPGLVWPVDPEGEPIVPPFLHLVDEYDSNDVYLVTQTTDPLLEQPYIDAGASAIGVWRYGGELDETTYPLDSAVYETLRPWGNQTVIEYDEAGNEIGSTDGVATKELGYAHIAGWAQRDQQSAPVAGTLSEYPADTQPIVLTMERRFDDTTGFEGEGWIATIEFSDPTRAPDARAIGIYDENWGYLYTTGAFVWTDTGETEPVDPDDPDGPQQAVFKWQTVNPPGRVTVDKEPIYYALLFGSLQEGRMALEAAVDERVDNFWDKNQDGSTTDPGLREWQDSGATVTGMGGTATLVSTTDPFIVGDLVRIEGVEMTITSISPGQWLVLDPYRVSTTGSIIEIYGPIESVTFEGEPVDYKGEGVTYGGS